MATKAEQELIRLFLRTAMAHIGNAGLLIFHHLRSNSVYSEISVWLNPMQHLCSDEVHRELLPMI